MKIRSVLAARVATLFLVGVAAAQFASAQTPKRAVDALVGTWTGPISAAGNTLTFVVQLKADDKGNLQGSLGVPEQGLAGLPLSDIQFADNKFSFKIALVMGEFTSTHANGVLDGQWRQGGMPDGVALVLKKGEYVAEVHTLKLDAETFGKLVGTWNGNLQVPAPQGEVTLPIVLRFETNAHGDKVAFMDSPSQNAHDIAVTEVTLAAGKLVVKIPSLGGEYDANLSGNTMAGQLSQGPGSFPLTLTRK